MNARIYIGAGLIALLFVVWLAVVDSVRKPQPTPTFNFIEYTNTGGQWEALFRLEHPPRPILSEGLWELRYQTATGWARPSGPTIGWRSFGWDGTGSITAITVESTNRPARVVMDLWRRRRGMGGLYDRLMEQWEKLLGKPPELRGDVWYLTNQTQTTSMLQ